MTKKELIRCIGELFTIIAICFGVFFWFEARYTHASDMMKAMEVMQKMGTYFDLHIKESELKTVQEKIYTIEDRYCTDKSKPCTEEKMPQTVRERYRELKLEKEKLQKELKILQEKK